LYSAAEKARWAEIHLEALQRSTWDYFATLGNRPTMRADFDPQSGCHVYRIKETPDYTRLQTNVALGIGDVAGNLRAALDHAIWAIVSPRAGHLPKFDANGVGFPICDDVARLADNRAGKAIKPHLSANEWDIILLSLLDQSYPGIEGPFSRSSWGRWNAGHNHPLRILQSLSNDDKHRLLPTVLLLPAALAPAHLGPVASREQTIGGGGLLTVNVGGQATNTPGEVVSMPDTRTAPFGTPVSLNAEVYWVRYIGGDMQPHVEDAGEITPQVAFNDSSGVVHTLDRVACFVKFLLSEFEQVLP
jgi:hypothetical protein